MEPIFRARALRDGVSDERLQAAVARNELIRLRSGVYVPASDFRALPLEDRHRMVVIGGVPRLHADSVLSHISAAVLHGLPLWRTDVTRVNVTRAGTTTRATKRTSFHGAPLTPAEIVWIDGYRVTSLDRTVVDIARSLPFEQAVVIGDAAVRKGAEVERVPGGRKGSEQARRILAFLDGHAESPGESRSRVLMDRMRIARPQSQVTILDRSGRFVARVDFCWPEFGLVGEFDGLLKYKAAQGEDSSAVVADEKRREDRLRAAGWNVVRWVWDDLDEPARMLADLRDRMCERVGSPSAWRAA